VINNYEIVTSTRIGELQDRIRERIREGWQPIGGIAMVHEDDAGFQEPHMVFAQAIVSNREEQPRAREIQSRQAPIPLPKTAELQIKEEIPEPLERSGMV